MANTSRQDQGNSQMLPAELPILSIVSGRWVSMRTESINLDSVCIISKEYVRPRSVIEVLIWLVEGEEPIQLIITAALVERTCQGYGIHAQITGIGDEPFEMWQGFYRGLATGSSRTCPVTLRPARMQPKQRVVVMERALPKSTLDVLIRNGVVVDTVKSIAEVMSRVGKGRADLIVADLNSADYDGLEICRQLRELAQPPRSVLLTNRGCADEFESCMYAGATKVIARPVTPELLVAPLLKILDLELAGQQEGNAVVDAPDLKPAAQRPRSTTALDQISMQFSTWVGYARSFVRQGTARQSTLSYS